MEVNFTLVVQIIHFLFAWFLLRSLYFKPAIVALDKEQEEHDARIEKQRSWQHQVAVKEQEIASRWRMLKRFYKHNKPTVHADSLIVIKEEMPLLQAPSLDQEERDRMSHEIAHTIVSGVKDIYG